MQVPGIVLLTVVLCLDSWNVLPSIQYSVKDLSRLFCIFLELFLISSHLPTNSTCSIDNTWIYLLLSLNKHPFPQSSPNIHYSPLLEYYSPSLFLSLKISQDTIWLFLHFQKIKLFPHCYFILFIYFWVGRINGHIDGLTLKSFQKWWLFGMSSDH